MATRISIDHEIITLDSRTIDYRALRYFMWIDVVKWLPNNPKSEEKGGWI